MQTTESRKPRRLLFLFSDTGGGHRSPAYAVAETVRDLHGEQARVEVIDALADYAPWPLNHLADLYPHMVGLQGWPWAAGYHLSNSPHQTAVLARCCWPLLRTSIRRLLREHPADVVVCCHYLFSYPVARVLAEAGMDTPSITMVVDLLAAHAFWFVPGSTYYLVPTEQARRRGLACGFPAERVLTTGLPVGPRFAHAAQESPAAVRQRLGLDLDRPVVLVVNGAEGMGAPHRLCKAIVESGVRAQVVAVAGRNGKARARLATGSRELPVRVEGYVHNMHEWMRAADLLVTKAGPSTISEALVLGLPMVISGALPGQERPNVDLVVRGGAGIWAPNPAQVAGKVRALLSPGNPAMAQMAASARSLSQPDAARHVAEIVWDAAAKRLALRATCAKIRLDEPECDALPSRTALTPG